MTDSTAPETPQQTWSAVDAFFADVTAEPAAAVRVREAAAAAGLPDIAVAPNQGRLLTLLARTAGARRVLEVGTLGGYSTWWLTQALPDDGSVVTLELVPEHAAVARASLDAAGVGDRVEIHEGPALDSLDALVAAGVAPFDLAFVDADKQQLAAYTERVVALSRPGTLIVVDNVVRGGGVVDPAHPDDRVHGVRAFATAVAADDRLEATVVQTVGAKGYDGFALLRVR
ncbi:O-methyltransferase [Cellulomonas sp. SLBN-39]|uniref:O-methyltransferase n=1 Tax=Cellulomonas sp. SLBN-39 TaxID=2768446 RepID=UPI001153E017|nr:O-methyltransferase [Cellulomonas sp. SLBN-39]TQL04086.1 putative O-methyltransferase YrrM [Cellulomonas sp. SLBN-39]